MARTTRLLGGTAFAMSLCLVGCTEGSQESVSGTTEGALTADVPVLRFSAIPDQNTALLKQKFQPLAETLAETLRVPVQYVPAADYGASVEMFKNGEIMLAWFGGLTGVQARRAVEGAHAIAQGFEDPNYRSYFIANTESGLEVSDEFPEGLAKVRFAFGSVSSTSGRLMPEYFIRQHAGVSPEAFFEKPFVFSGSHDKTAKLVESGAADAGVLSYKTFDAMIEDERLDPQKVQVIWQTPEYADYNFTAHPELETRYGEGFTERLREALLAIDDPEVLDAFPRSALIPAEDDDFRGIVEVATQLDMLR